MPKIFIYETDYGELNGVIIKSKTPHEVIIKLNVEPWYRPGCRKIIEETWFNSGATIQEAVDEANKRWRNAKTETVQ